MPLDVIVVMDSIGAITVAKDSTFAMLLAAQRRGHRLHYVLPGGLALVDGQALARVAPLQVRDTAADWFSLGPAALRTFGSGDVVLMRKEPPVDADFIHDTQILSLARRQGARVVNAPQGLRDMNEKLAALAFPQCIPPTVVSRDAAQLNSWPNTMMRY